MLNFQDLTVDECRAFVVSQMYKFLKEWIEEKRESAIENIQTLDNPTLMACISGELTAITHTRKLLLLIDDKANGRMPKQEDTPSNMGSYGSDKPTELTDPIKLRD